MFQFPFILYLLDLRPRRPESVAELYESRCPINRSADTGAHHDSQAEPVAGRPTGRQAAKIEVIASGNAQAVFRRLREIEASRSANLDRWVWELLQNARDAAGTFATVEVTVGFDGTMLTFRHD